VEVETPPPSKRAVVIPGTVVATVGTVGTVGTRVVVVKGAVGKSPRVLKVSKDEVPPPPMLLSRKAVLRPGTVVVTVGTAATVGVTGATTADSGNTILMVAGGAGGTKVVMLNPAGVTAGAVAVMGRAVVRELSKTLALRYGP